MRLIPLLEPASGAMAFFMLHEKALDNLVHLALIHAEFESLHPFLDGNGRLGRMLTPLFLFERKVLSRPVFYTSAWLEVHCDQYYAIISLYKRENQRVEEVTKSHKASQAIEYFFNRPVFRSSDFVNQSGIPAPTNFICGSWVSHNKALCITVMVLCEHLIFTPALECKRSSQAI